MIYFNNLQFLKRTWTQRAITYCDPYNSKFFRHLRTLHIYFTPYTYTYLDIFIDLQFTKHNIILLFIIVTIYGVVILSRYQNVTVQIYWRITKRNFESYMYDTVSYKNQSCYLLKYLKKIVISALTPQKSRCANNNYVV